MCSIIVSTNAEKTKELIDLNQHRGSFSFSSTEFDDKIRPDSQVKGFGEYAGPVTDQLQVCHVQAPTGGMIQDANRIHPTQIRDTMLWHNGLITPRGIRYLQEKLQSDETFDTKLLHQALDQFGFEILSEIEGLFSCVYYNKELFMFRTRHGKLYTHNGDVSSERFENSRCINADTVYRLNLEEIAKFKTKRFNFIVPGEL